MDELHARFLDTDARIRHGCEADHDRHSMITRQLAREVDYAVAQKTCCHVTTASTQWQSQVPAA